MPINDPWAGYRNSRDQLFNTLDQRRQEAINAPLQAAQLRSMGLSAQKDELALGQMQQAVQDQQALRDLETKLAAGKEGQTPNPALEGSNYKLGAGPLSPTVKQNVPYAPLEMTQMRSQARLAQGDVAGAEKVVDVTHKIRGTEAEAKGMLLLDAYQQMGIAGVKAVLQANGQDPARADALQFNQDGLGYSQDLGDQGVLYVRRDRDGLKAEIKGKASQSAAKPLPTKNLQGPDGKEHVYAWNPETGRYDVDQGLAPPKAGGSGGSGSESFPMFSKLIAEGYIPTQRMTKPYMQAMEGALKVATDQGVPITPDFMRSAEFESAKNVTTGRSAGSRLVVARKQNIEQASGLLDDLQKTNQTLDYSDVQFAALVDKWSKGQLQDPVFTEYMAQRADALFVLGNAFKQNGLTDKSIEIEEEAFRPTLAPKAFAGWVNAQKRALNRAANEMEKDYKYTMKQDAVFEAGQGGAPSASQPVPQQQKDIKPLHQIGDLYKGRKITRRGVDESTGKIYVMVEGSMDPVEVK
jgi:hypothetical protein